jgi:CRP-like cAMP-binding protein
VSERSSSQRNLVLGQLAADDLSLLQHDLEKVDLPLRYRLANAGAPIKWVYFPEDGIASITTRVQHDVPVEIGIIGREGVANVSLVVGSERAVNDTFMQVAGSGSRIAAGKLSAALRQSPALHAVLLRYVHVLMVQTTATALANGRATITERLARWLLMAQDRVDGDDIALTHEFLATMLGVRRPGVTAALSDAERHGLVSGRRGVITVLDREGLEIAANGYYGTPEAEWRRMFAAT